MSRMGRRKFVALLGGAAATRPLTARAQRPSMPVVAFLGSHTVRDRRGRRSACDARAP